MKHILSINEYRKQLEIPFNNKHPLHDKPVHQHIHDVLLDLGKECDYEKFIPQSDISDGFTKENIDKAREMFVEYDTDYPQEVADIIAQKYPYSEYPELYSEDVEEDFESQYVGADNVLWSEDLHEYLSDKGIELADKLLRNEVFDEFLDMNDIKYYLENSTDEYGLVDIYRAISYHKTYDGDIIKADEYENAIKYGGVGIYWTWDLGSAEPHSSGNYSNSYILHAKVKPEDINYPNTIYKAVYNLRDEQEVELNEDAKVLVYAISNYHDTKKIKNFKKPICVNV